MVFKEFQEFFKIFFKEFQGPKSQNSRILAIFQEYFWAFQEFLKRGAIPGVFKEFSRSQINSRSIPGIPGIQGPVATLIQPSVGDTRRVGRDQQDRLL